MTMTTSLRPLAEAASRQAYAPYSRLHVGAALRAASGEIYSGCNVENGSLSIGSCAERAARVASASRPGQDAAGTEAQAPANIGNAK